MKIRQAAEDVGIVAISAVILFWIGGVYFNGLNYLFIIVLSYFMVDWMMSDFALFFGAERFHSRFILLFFGMVLSSGIADGELSKFDPYLRQMGYPSDVVWACVLIELSLLSILEINPRRIAQMQSNRRARQAMQP
jgi:hypothetical protein